MRTYIKLYTLAANTPVMLEDVPYEQVQLIPAKSYAAAGGMNLTISDSLSQLLGLVGGAAAFGSDTVITLYGMFGLWAMNANASAVLVVIGSGAQIDVTGAPL